MHGRVTAFTASGTSQVVVLPAESRTSIEFYADGALFLQPGQTATATGGIPHAATGPLVIVGRLATGRWSLISAGTPRLGVIEYFEDDFGTAPVVEAWVS